MLDAEVRAYLEAQAGAPPRSSLSIVQTRAAYLQARALAGEPPPMARVEERGAPVRMRVYEPAGRAGDTVVAYFHGGRFISGDLETHDPVCRSLAAASGCRVAAVDYRLAPEHRFPAALEDCYSAVASLGGRIVVCGDSAGGNLAAATALLARERGGPALAFQVLIYPMLDASCSSASHAEYAEGYGPGSRDMLRGYLEYAPSADPRDPYLSPLWSRDLSGLPPALILTAEYDSLRDEGEIYGTRLRAAGVAAEVKRYDGAIHGFFQMAGILSLGRRALADVASCLRAIG